MFAELAAPGAGPKHEQAGDAPRAVAMLVAGVNSCDGQHGSFAA